MGYVPGLGLTCLAPQVSVVVSLALPAVTRGVATLAVQRGAAENQSAATDESDPLLAPRCLATAQQGTNTHSS